MTESSFAGFQRTILELYGTRGELWLQQLPALLEACERRWSLQIGPHFPELSYNYVAPAVRADGTAVVLKLGVPGLELRREIAALNHYAGRGIARLLESDEVQGVLLLERLSPGELLSTVTDDEAATTIAAGVMQTLWRPVQAAPPLITVADWHADFAALRKQHGGQTGPLPARLVERADKTYAELMASMGPPVLLHGDLHHYNILTAEREPWLAIDPKGVVGEAEYEVGALIRNPGEIFDRPDLERIQARRLDQLSEHLGFDRQRLLGWSFSQAVLSAVWTVQDHGDGWEPMVVLAETLEQKLTA